MEEYLKILERGFDPNLHDEEQFREIFEALYSYPGNYFILLDILINFQLYPRYVHSAQRLFPQCLKNMIHIINNDDPDFLELFNRLRSLVLIPHEYNADFLRAYSILCSKAIDPNIEEVMRECLNIISNTDLILGMKLANTIINIIALNLLTEHEFPQKFISIIYNIISQEYDEEKVLDADFIDILSVFVEHSRTITGYANLYPFLFNYPIFMKIITDVLRIPDKLLSLQENPDFSLISTKYIENSNSYCNMYTSICDIAYLLVNYKKCEHKEDFTHFIEENLPTFFMSLIINIYASAALGLDKYQFAQDTILLKIYNLWKKIPINDQMYSLMMSSLVYYLNLTEGEIDEYQINPEVFISLIDINTKNNSKAIPSSIKRILKSLYVVSPSQFITNILSIYSNDYSNGTLILAHLLAKITKKDEKVDESKIMELYNFCSNRIKICSENIPIRSIQSIVESHFAELIDDQDFKTLAQETYNLLSVFEGANEITPDHRLYYSIGAMILQNLYSPRLFSFFDINNFIVPLLKGLSSTYTEAAYKLFNKIINDFPDISQEYSDYYIITLLNKMMKLYYQVTEEDDILIDFEEQAENATLIIIGIIDAGKSQIPMSYYIDFFNYFNVNTAELISPFFNLLERLMDYTEDSYIFCFSYLLEKIQIDEYASYVMDINNCFVRFINICHEKLKLSDFYLNIYEIEKNPIVNDRFGYNTVSGITEDGQSNTFEMPIQNIQIDRYSCILIVEQLIQVKLFEQNMLEQEIVPLIINLINYDGNMIMLKLGGYELLASLILSYPETMQLLNDEIISGWVNFIMYYNVLSNDYVSNLMKLAFQSINSQIQSPLISQTLNSIEEYDIKPTEKITEMTNMDLSSSLGLYLFKLWE